MPIDQTPPLPPEEIARRITGLIEIDEGLSLGALTVGGGRGAGKLIFSRYLAAYIMVERFNLQVEHAAKLLNRERGTVTKALKVFKFLEGYQGWRRALDTIADLSILFVDYGAQRIAAQAHTPAPVGRNRRNDALPCWVRDSYAMEMEAAAEQKLAREARERAEADSIYLRHPAVKALTDDPEIQRLLGQVVVSVTLSPLDDPRSRQPVLLVPPRESTTGAIALRLLVEGDSPTQLKAMMDARAAAGRALQRSGFRLTGVAETFASRDRLGWRYIPLHIAQIRAA